MSETEKNRFDTLEKLARDVRETVSTAKGEITGEIQSKLEKQQEYFDSTVETIEKNHAEKRRKEREEIDARIAEIEKSSMSARGSEEVKQVSYRELMNGALKQMGVNSVDKAPTSRDMEKFDAVRLEEKSILLGRAPSGGFLASPEYMREILKPMEDMSPVRQYATVRQSGRMQIQVNRRDTLMGATFEGETEAKTEDSSTYKQTSLTAYRLTAHVIVSSDSLADDTTDIEAEIVGDANERFAIAEGRNFVIGDGVKKPQGLIHSGNGVASIDTATSGAWDEDDVINLGAELKEYPNPVFFGNRKTRFSMMSLKDGQQRPLITFDNSMQSGAPVLVLGYPYATFQDMPGTGLTGQTAGDAVLGFGDLGKGYMIHDVLTQNVIVNPYSLDDSAEVKYTFHRWLTGAVVLPDAIKLLKVKA